MYLLTLQFDFNRKTNGRFSGDAVPAAGPLSKSNNWIRLDPSGGVPEPDFPAPPVPPALPTPFVFDVEGARWKDLEQAGALYIPRPDPQVIGIYIRQDTDPNAGPALDANATVSLAVCFGRPTRAHQAQASPITVDGTDYGPVKTTFIFKHEKRNSGPGWFFPLGKIAFRPKDPNLSHRYEFALGIEVHDVTNGVTRYYGEDPEIDVGDY